MGATGSTVSLSSDLIHVGHGRAQLDSFICFFFFVILSVSFSRYFLTVDFVPEQRNHAAMDNAAEPFGPAGDWVERLYYYADNNQLI